jgi:hypothetical protein
VIKADLKRARKTLWTELELRAAKLTPKGTLNEVRSKALLLWRANLWATPLAPNEFH